MSCLDSLLEGKGDRSAQHPWKSCTVWAFFCPKRFTGKIGKLSLLPDVKESQFSFPSMFSVSCQLNCPKTRLSCAILATPLQSGEICRRHLMCMAGPCCTVLSKSVWHFWIRQEVIWPWHQGKQQTHLHKHCKTGGQMSKCGCPLGQS